MEINDNLSVISSDGYLAIVQIKQNNNEDNRKTFDSVIKKLQDINTDDSHFYAEQLKKALALSSSLEIR